MSQKVKKYNFCTILLTFLKIFPQLATCYRKNWQYFLFYYENILYYKKILIIKNLH